MDRDEQAAIASHAAQMLIAAKYTVRVDPALGTSLPAPGTDAHVGQSLDDRLLELTDRIRGARSGADLSEAAGLLLHPESGVLERVREALEAVGEQITDLDDEAYQLADRFAIASEFVTAAEGELLGVGRELAQIRTPQPYRAQPAAHKAATATSPAARRAGPSARSSTSAAPPAPAGASNQQSGPRVR
jgi:gas vesicle protein